ncbi:hypothetical protein P8C59_004309 [Phyllachora maydis]|uniref:Uncharacterized protein n=1 Tax=Phyllachora maydis TaxID=1825666 RepID=A0AAD9I3B3_9PEZI|nr:hypothetical protein P8C59_004309 [Phyllachora maydis]
MYIYIACLPCRCCYCDLSFANLLIANIDFFSNLDNLVYTILAPILAKPAKITLAAYTIVGRAAAAKHYKKCKEAVANAQAYKLAKKEDLQRSKRTASSNAGRYTIDSGLIANKDNNNAYNRVYMPPAKVEKKEEGSSGNDNSVNSGTSDSTDKGKGSGAYKHSKGALRCKDTPLHK